MIFGISLEGEAAHRKFRPKENNPFDLLADPRGYLCRLYDARIKNFLIAKVSDRVTNVIGKDGIIPEAFSKVEPNHHAAEVLACIVKIREA